MKDVQVFDGVTVATRGDTFVSMWKQTATLNRVRWHGALLEQHVGKHRGEALVLMVVLPSAGPPQGEARLESNAVVRRIGSHLRLAVTAALGDTLQMQVVRTVMRGMFLISGNTKRLMVVSTEAQAIERLLAQAERPTPSRAELEATLSALRTALSEEPELDRVAPDGPTLSRPPPPTSGAARD